MSSVRSEVNQAVLNFLGDSYLAGAFIYRLRSRLKVSERGHTKGNVIRYFTPHPLTDNAVCSARLIERMRWLYWIAISNFVLPCILSLVQLVLIFRDSNFLVSTYVNLVNNYVDIIGVIFATVWSTGSNWATEKGLVSHHTPSSDNSDSSASSNLHLPYSDPRHPPLRMRGPSLIQSRSLTIHQDRLRKSEGRRLSDTRSPIQETPGSIVDGLTEPHGCSRDHSPP